MVSFFNLRANPLIVLLMFFIVVFHPMPLLGDDPECSKEDTVLISNIAGLSIITTWGILNWDYFKRSPREKSEGWFSSSTDSGGFDKLGHFHFSYTLSHLLAGLYEYSGYDSRRAAGMGALSSFAMTSWMEAGDAFSEYGFAWEDFVMNLVGSTAGYLFYIHPEISSKIDFRIEIEPDFSTLDFVTDYDQQKFVVAVKLDGFEFFQDNFLKYFEFHLGYYTRGYPDQTDKSRNIYAGIGLNVSRLFKSLSMRKTSRFFNYFQMPYTYVEKKKNLD